MLDKVIGGWGINTIITFQAGYPDYRRWLPGCAQQFRYSQRRLRPADENCPLAPVGRFQIPEDKVSGTTLLYSPPVPPITTVMAPIRVPSPTYVADGQKNFDFAAFKNTKFGPDGRFGFEFRGEFFNLFNRTQFNPPAGWGGSIGQVSGQYNLPRVVQFAGRITF